jgi:hypothetical protein
MTEVAAMATAETVMAVMAGMTMMAVPAGTTEKAVADDRDSSSGNSNDSSRGDAGL